MKLMFISMFILISSFAALDYLETKAIREVIQGEALEKARSDLQTGLKIIDLSYPGDWNVVNDQLYKGETLINNNYEIVDEIGTLTNGNTATIFLHDTRVTTTVLLDGERTVGTQISEVVGDSVLNRGETYIGQANVVGHTYQSAYMPIKDATGAIIGIWYVGAPDASERIEGIIQEITKKIIILSTIIMMIAAFVNFLFTRPIIRRITTAVSSIQALARGEFNEKQLEVNTKDETGVLLESVNRMRAELRSTLMQVNDSSKEVVSTSSKELTANAEQTSKATEQISLSIHEVSAAAELLDTMAEELQEVVGRFRLE